MSGEPRARFYVHEFSVLTTTTRSTRFGSTHNRPGWKSPLLGKTVSLDWLDDLMNGQSGFEWVKGQDEWEDGWRDKKLVALEFWTS